METEPGQDEGEGGVKMVPMGLKGAVTCMQIIFMAHAHGEGLHLQEQAGAESVHQQHAYTD